MIKTSFEYHESTSYDRHDMSGHYLDWKNQPMVFKDYPGVMPVILPAEVDFPHINLLELIQKEKPGEQKESLDLIELSAILRRSYSLTARARQGGGDFYFRSAASAGALYPCELYVATHSINELEDGIYHFAIHRHCLYPLRRGDMTAYLAESIQMNLKTKPVLTFLLSAIYFRSAWKYRERSYRYHLLDSGHLLENLILALNALSLNFELSFDFNDIEINHLLGFNENKEVSLAAVAVPGIDYFRGEALATQEELSRTFNQASQVASKEVDYPIVREMHRAGIQIRTSPQTDPVIHDHLGLKVKEWIKNPTDKNGPTVMGFAEAVYQRRSKRNFVKEALGSKQLDLLLDALCRPNIDSRLKPDHLNTLAIGLLINQVDGVSPGFYMLDKKTHSIGSVKPGKYSQEIARVCLDQAWLANTAVHALFLTNLKILEETWGPRGYRYAMMTAGRLGQRLYLMATAMGLGCCGIGAFYDHEVSELLELNKESRLLYLVAFGPVKSRGGT
jgi:SagB-type dehydrogenase family enzyme